VAASEQPMFTLRPKRSPYGSAKRVLDAALAGLLLTLSIVPMAVVALLVWLRTPTALSCFERLEKPGLTHARRRRAAQAWRAGQAYTQSVRPHMLTCVILPKWK